MNNNKKLSYEAPKLDVVVFGAKDIITTSGFAGGEIPMGPAVTDISDEIF